MLFFFFFSLKQDIGEGKKKVGIVLSRCSRNFLCDTTEKKTANETCHDQSAVCTCLSVFVYLYRLDFVRPKLFTNGSISSDQGKISLSLSLLLVHFFFLVSVFVSVLRFIRPPPAHPPRRYPNNHCCGHSPLAVAGAVCAVAVAPQWKGFVHEEQTDRQHLSQQGAPPGRDSLLLLLLLQPYEDPVGQPRHPLRHDY